jgi:hypothetical protein
MKNDRTGHFGMPFVLQLIMQARPALDFESKEITNLCRHPFNLELPQLSDHPRWIIGLFNRSWSFFNALAFFLRSGCETSTLRRIVVNDALGEVVRRRTFFEITYQNTGHVLLFDEVNQNCATLDSLFQLLNYISGGIGIETVSLSPEQLRVGEEFILSEQDA